MTASATTTTASNHGDVTWDVNAIFITDDDASLPFASETTTTACDNSVVLFISNDGDTPLSNIFKPHIKDKEMEETLFLENVIMSLGKLSLVKVVMKDDPILVYLHWTHCKYKLPPSILSNFIDKNEHLRWEH